MDIGNKSNSSYSGLCCHVGDVVVVVVGLSLVTASSKNSTSAGSKEGKFEQENENIGQLMVNPIMIG